MIPFRVFSVEREGETIIVLLGENVNKFGESDVLGEMQRLVEHLQEEQFGNVVIDFDGLDYFGSSMLEALRILWMHLHERGSKMVLCDVSTVGREILELSKFDTLWPIVETRADAKKLVEK